MKFSDQLIEKAAPFFTEQLKKPFLQGLVNGDLPESKYLYWVKVDYPYLINFSRILALGVTKADDLDGMRVMQSYLAWILDVEMASHEEYAKQHGITKEELASQRMGLIKYAYTRHELANAYSGGLVELIAGLTPCIVGWQILAKSLVKGREISPTNPYKDWLDMYSSDVNLGDHTKKILDLLDRLALECSHARLTRIEKIFMISEQFETICWDAYYNEETWPNDNLFT